MHERELIGISALLYIGGFLYALYCLTRGRRYERWVLYPLMLIGFILQTTGLYHRGAETGGCPLGNLFEILQFISWTIVLLYLFIGPSLRQRSLGFFSAGLASVIAVISFISPALDPPSMNGFANPWIELHAALAVASYGVFGMLSLTCLMYIIQNFGLKNRRIRGLFSFLPSIRELEWINHRLFQAGTGILTFSVILGSFYWFPHLESVNMNKLLLTFALWLTTLFLFLLHQTGKLISIRFAYTCIALFLFALITLIPVDESRLKKPVETPTPALTTTSIIAKEGVLSHE